MNGNRISNALAARDPLADGHRPTDLLYNASMSKGPTLPRRWLRFKLLVTAVAFVTLSIFCAHASADDGSAALPDEVTRPITKVLPDTWTYETQRSRLVLRPRRQPVFVNLTNADRPAPNETLDDYNRRHTVKFDYRIVVRFEPKLSLPEVWHLVLENRGIYYSLEQVEKEAGGSPNKGHNSFPNTPEGDILSRRRDQLLQSFRSVPAGYLRNMSVYVESTYLGYAEFLHDEEKQEVEAVEKRIRGQLTPYFSEPTNMPPPK